MSETHDLVIVGAGPAGVAAALTAARHRLSVGLVDEYPEPGGQYFRPVPAAFRQPGPHDDDPRRTVLEEIRHQDVDLRMGMAAWGLFPERRVALSDGTFLQGRAVLVATGAYERCLGFPGWTLPGVMSAGGIQLLVKSQRILPGQRVLLSGCGPFLLPVAADLLEAGANVVAVLEAVPWSRTFRFGVHALASADRRRQARHYAATLLRHRTPYIHGASMVEVFGEGEARWARWARLDALGYPRPGTAQEVEVDLVGIGFGFVPAVELLDTADAKLVYDADRGGWAPALTEALETTVPGLFAAGETAGIGGVDLALAEGRIVGLEVARRLGRPVSDEEVKGVHAQRRGLLSFASALNRAFVPPPGLSSLLRDDVTVCRCDESTAAEVVRVIDRGCHNIDSLKCEVRIGMGSCQGRLCAPLCGDLIVRRTGLSREAVGRLHLRPPVRPVPVTALTSMP